MSNVFEQQRRDIERSTPITRKSGIFPGLAGSIPFWGFAILAALVQTPDLRVKFLEGDLYWAAVILAFMAGGLERRQVLFRPLPTGTTGCGSAQGDLTDPSLSFRAIAKP